MTIRNLFSLIYAVFGLLVGLLGVLVILLTLNQRDLARAHNTHFRSRLLADMMRQSSEYLTRFARNYVATGNPKFEEYYWAVLDMRNGKRPIPEQYDVRIFWDLVAAGQLSLPEKGRCIPYLDILREAGITGPEMAKLNESKANSDDLVRTEEIAMHAMKGLYADPSGGFTRTGAVDQAMAIRLMNDHNYYLAKAAIMEPIDEFYRMIETRTAADVAATGARGLILLRTIFFVLLVMAGLGVFSLIVVRQKVVRPVLMIKDQTALMVEDLGQLSQVTREIVRGHWSQAYATRALPLRLSSPDEVGDLASMHDTMLQRLQETGEDIARITAALEGRVMKRTEELKAAQRQLMDIIDFLPDATFAIDTGGRVIAWNRAIQVMTGLRETEVMGKGDYVYALPFWGERRPLLIDAVVQEDRDIGRHYNYTYYEERGAVRSAEAFVQRMNNGQGAYYWVTATPLLDKDGRIVGAIEAIRDITERKKAEAKIQELNDTLEQRVRDRTEELAAANKELEAFSYSVSHDLRAPLRHIAGFVQLLQDHVKTLNDAKVSRYTGIIAAASTKMGTLIDDLLAFSRTGRAQMHLAPVALAELVAECRKDLAGDLEGRQVEWVIGEMPVVTADAALMRQVFANLLGNAVKYTRPRPQAVITVSACPGQDEVVVCVRDNGAGFDMRYADKLFGVFQRLHADTEFEGTGIGLANVRRIIARHGGRTWAEGEVGVGASFYFSLPSRLVVT